MTGICTHIVKHFIELLYVKYFCVHLPCVYRFHNPSEEVSLNFDVVPPLSDDVQLTVDQYRSKLYEVRLRYIILQYKES